MPNPPPAPTFTFVVLRVEIDGKVVGHLVGTRVRQDLPRTHLIPTYWEKLACCFLGPCGKTSMEKGSQEGGRQTDKFMLGNYFIVWVR